MRSPPLNQATPSLCHRRRENTEMAMPCAKKEVFLARLARVKRRTPRPALLQRKKNQLLQPQVLTSFSTSKQYSLSSAPTYARHMFPPSKSASNLSLSNSPTSSAADNSRKFFQLQSTSESTSFSLPRNVRPSGLAAYRRLQRQRNRQRAKYSSRERFLLLTMRSLRRAGSAERGAGGSSRQGRSMPSGSSDRWQSRKKVRGAMFSGLLTVLSSLAGR